MRSFSSLSACTVIFRTPVEPATRTRGRSQLLGNSAPFSGSVTHGPAAPEGAPNIPATSAETPTSKYGSLRKSLHRPTHGGGRSMPLPPKPPMPMLPPRPPVPIDPAEPSTSVADDLTPAHPAAPPTAA